MDRVPPYKGEVTGSSPVFLTKNMEGILAEMYLYVPPGCKEFKVFICNKTCFHISIWLEKRADTA